MPVAILRCAEQQQLAHGYFRSRNRDAVLLEAVILDASFDVNAVTLAHVIFRQLRHAVPQREAMPLRAVLEVAIALDAAAGRQRYVRDFGSGIGGLDVRITADVADQNDFVDAARHWRPPHL